MAFTNYKDGFTSSGIGASATIGPVTLLGGKYSLAVLGGGTLSTQLQMTLPDGTFGNVGSAISAASVTTFDLPPGTYKVTTGASSSANAVSLARVPYRAA